MREEHYQNLKDRRYVSLEQARSKKLMIDWSEYTPTTPSFLGTKVFDNWDLNTVLEHIDWNPFFQVWQIRGKYPNRGYPKIFKDPTVGEEAKKLHNDATKMIQEIIKNKSLRAVAVVGLYPANSVGDDIEVYSDESRTKVEKVFYGLRQQAEKDVESNEPYYCLSDFVAPKESGVKDYIGIFPVHTLRLIFNSGLILNQPNRNVRDQRWIWSQGALRKLQQEPGRLQSHYG